MSKIIIILICLFQFIDCKGQSDCKIKDGEHEADVKYYNPSTGTNRTYTLQVDVEDCEVTVIYFPKGGWLDGTHITPAAIDENGDAVVKDDKGRKFYIHID
jgi:hypothetical protein